MAILVWHFVSVFGHFRNLWFSRLRGSVWFGWVNWLRFRFVDTKSILQLFVNGFTVSLRNGSAIEVIDIPVETSTSAFRLRL